MRVYALETAGSFREMHSMRYLLKSRRSRLLVSALLLGCATWVVAAFLQENEDVEDIYNWRLHRVLVERQATGIQDLAERFLMQQELYLWISPPDPDFILFQPGETIPILDLKAFPASFIDNLAGEIGADGVVRFRVWIYEDAGSPGREIVIESLEQTVIARIGRDRDYSPEWFVRALYPALDTYDEWRRDWLTACYDPARVCMRYDLLVGEDNLIEYVWARSIEAARLAEEREAAAMMRSGEEGGSVSNLQFTAIGPTTNSTIGLTLAWPDEGLGTNVGDIFACTDLCARDWVLADTLTLDMQTNRVVWVDAESTNHVTRFYDAWTHHDSDGDGIPDGREVRLYGTDAHDWDTDGDGLSDFAELFVHGTSALNADSDGDGLPDGWEVQYGLDPLDATDDNGADGDPDGDGFTNLQEFQMGGDPANPAINATQLIHRLMHCRGDSSLRVDVEDSYNCGGTNPNRQEIEDIFSVGPLMHCGYLLSLTVEGRVEDHNSGYDKVSVRAYTATELQSELPFFEGHNNGNGCAMVDEQATTNVWFWSNGSVRLRYDTADGLYHTDAYAEITAAAFVDVLEVELKDGANIVNDNGYVYINSTPQMPQITAALKPANLPGNAKWRLHIEYKRNPRNDDAYYPGPTAASWKTLLAGEVWNIADEFAADFRGGKATLYCEYQGLEFEHVFHIRGNNPTEAAAEAEIGNNPWYAIPIARHESGTQNGRTYIQFNEVGTLGPNPADFKHCPNFGAPNGWGIMQLDPPPSDEALWNWKQNIADGKAHLANPCRTAAVAWIANQEAQQQAEEPGMPLENYIFTFNGVDFRKGTDRTPIDACTIQRYNGAALWVIYWKNKTPTEPGSWQIRDTHRAYVDIVCGEID